MKLQQVTEAANIIVQATKKLEHVSPVRFAKAAEGTSLKLELAGDTFQTCHKSGEYQPLKTMDEAVRYAKDVLGIKTFKMSNIDMANYTLQALGKIKKITGTNIGIKKVIGEDVIIHPITGEPNIGIIGSMISSKGILKLSEKAMRMDFARKIDKLCMTDPKNIKEYMNLRVNVQVGSVPLCEIMQRIKKLNCIPRTLDDIPNQTVFHEVWHRLHYLNCKKVGIDYYKLGKQEELNEWGISDRHFFEEFMSPGVRKTISEYKMVGSYALTSPCEFVAEVGSLIANGIKPPKEIMDLYYKFYGPKSLISM